MAVGTVTPAANCKRAVCLMTAQTANTSIPTAATDGIPNYPTRVGAETDDGACYAVTHAEASTLLIHNSAGSGTVAGTFTLWGYLAASGAWYEVPVNGGTAVTPVALAETDTDLVTHREVFEHLGHFDRLCLQLTGVSGTDTAFDAWLVTHKPLST